MTATVTGSYVTHCGRNRVTISTNECAYVIRNGDAILGHK